MPRHAERRTGFTLLEVLVVLVVIALLATLVGPQILGRVSEARETTARTQMELLALALDNYRLDNGIYPTTDQGLAALRMRPQRQPVPTNWRGPYLKKDVPDDPWGRPYAYSNPSERDPAGYSLVTLGRDGTSGGVGENADIAIP